MIKTELNTCEEGQEWNQRGDRDKTFLIEV